MLQNLPQMKELAKEICVREGCDLYDLDFSPGSKGQGRRLLVYVEKQGGVSLEDCERVSKGLSEVLDEKNLIPDGEYALEVSSPGLERPLKEKWHFDAVVGQKIFVQSTESMDPTASVPRYKVNGKLEKVNETEITVKADGKDFVIPINNVKKSNVIFDYDSANLNKMSKKKN
jgi:ribosome maturation factor RimP